MLLAERHDATMAQTALSQINAGIRDDARRRRPPLVVAVALANKTARIAWAVMLRQREYQPRAMAA
jgi:hypothetical protein